ncbi:hypothetical protein J2Z29_000354 [Treponema pedis]
MRTKKLNKDFIKQDTIKQMEDAMSAWLCARLTHECFR